MHEKAIRIGICAPATPFAPDLAERVSALSAERFGANAPELIFHPQCYQCDNHFAGPDEARRDALVELANDPTIDAVWFARGGYGSNRIAADAIARFSTTALTKTFMGYSDCGFMLAGLYKAGFKAVHGPMPADILRENGADAVARALDFLVRGDRNTLEAGLDTRPVAAFNLTILTSLVGTKLEPDLAGHVLLIEDVSEYMYRIDRMLFQLAAHPAFAKLAGIRLGRVSDVPENTPDFGHDAVALLQHWCARAAIPYLGAADIGHDSANKVVPFGIYHPK